MNTELANAKRTARRWAKGNGHALDGWTLEAGRPTAQCPCGGYVFVQREGSHYVYGTGRLPVPSASNASQTCRRACLPGYRICRADLAQP